jgi:hypothetical protein
MTEPRPYATRPAWAVDCDPDPAQAVHLARLIHEWSEREYCATWLGGCEAMTWDIAEAGETELAQLLRHWACRAGGWVEWRDLAEGERCLLADVGPFGRSFLEGVGVAFVPWVSA